MNSLVAKVQSLIRDVPDFPKKGIVFKDITPVLKDAAAFDRVCAALEGYALDRGTDVVAGIESRGFIFGGALAVRMGRPFVPIRKKGKLPWKTVRQSYSLEYGKDTLEIHRDAVEKGRRVLVVDDLLATGGTLAGACKLVEKVGGVVAGCACLVELSFLKGRARLKGRDFFCIVRY
jgi:adenine phosphoribosyltransferase